MMPHSDPAPSECEPVVELAVAVEELLQAGGHEPGDGQQHADGCEHSRVSSHQPDRRSEVLAGSSPLDDRSERGAPPTGLADRQHGGDDHRPDHEDGPHG